MYVHTGPDQLVLTYYRNRIQRRGGKKLTRILYLLNHNYNECYSAATYLNDNDIVLIFERVFFFLSFHTWTTNNIEFYPNGINTTPNSKKTKVSVRGVINSNSLVLSFLETCLRFVDDINDINKTDSNY